MFRRTVDDIVWLFFVLMFVLWSNSSSVQRQRRRADSDADAAARQNAETIEGTSSCRVLARAHESGCLGKSTHDALREADVQRCLDRLYTQTKWKRECRTLREGHCTCRVRADLEKNI